MSRANASFFRFDVDLRNLLELLKVRAVSLLISIPITLCPEHSTFSVSVYRRKEGREKKREGGRKKLE